jgi:hypothetical protein
MPIVLGRYEPGDLTSAACDCRHAPACSLGDGTLDFWDVLYKQNERVYPIKVDEAALSTGMWTCLCSITCVQLTASVPQCHNIFCGVCVRVYGMVWVCVTSFFLSFSSYFFISFFTRHSLFRTFHRSQRARQGQIVGRGLGGRLHDHPEPVRQLVYLPGFS